MNSEKLLLKQNNFIIKSNNIHNNKYAYDLVRYKTNKTKVEIICPDHGKFLQAPKVHLSGSGCQACSGVKKLDTAEFIKKSKNIHGNKYNYENTIFISFTKHINIICLAHGEFYQSPTNHLLGGGCALCSKRAPLTTESFIKKSIYIHKNRYNYELSIFSGAHHKVQIICYNHGPFQQRANAHLMGQGCPACSSNISKVETKWLDNLNIPKENRNKLLKIKNKIFNVDALLNTTVYEFYGDYWHGNPKVFANNKLNKRINKTFGELYNYTIRREEEIKSVGFDLVSIWESDFRK